MSFMMTDRIRKKMHNYYTYLYNQAVYEVVGRKIGPRLKRFCLRARRQPAAKSFPCIGAEIVPRTTNPWPKVCAADCHSACPDSDSGAMISGDFESNSSADVYKRWLAFGLLSSHSRLHGSRYYRVPWLYDEEAVDVARFFYEIEVQAHALFVRCKRLKLRARVCR
jgi:alpha-D-xyloside xylohydrolase